MASPSVDLSSDQDSISRLTARIIEYEQSRKRLVRKPDPSERRFLTLNYSGFGLVLASLGFFVLYVKAGPHSVLLGPLQVLTETSILLAIGTVVLAYSFGVAAIRRSWPSIQKARDRFVFFTEMVPDLDAMDFAFISELQREHDSTALEFVAKRWASRVNHRRTNFGMLIGSPSQLKLMLYLPVLLRVGLIPKLLPSLHENWLPILIFGALYSVLVILTVLDEDAGQRVEQIMELLLQAVERKKNEAKSSS